MSDWVWFPCDVGPLRYWRYTPLGQVVDELREPAGAYENIPIFSTCALPPDVLVALGRDPQTP